MAFDDYVAQLAIPHRAKHAMWSLVLGGADALPAVRRGLASDDRAVRVGCTRVLDHLVDEESWPELIALLDDPDAEVRAWAMHSLACDVCKENSCRPDPRALMEPALRLLTTDPSRYVRAAAVGVVGRWVHDEPEARAAMIDAHQNDAHPSVRKKAGWFVPGGTVYEKTRPNLTR
jgi:HEAT repeat protein